MTKAHSKTKRRAAAKDKSLREDLAKRDAAVTRSAEPEHRTSQPATFPLLTTLRRMWAVPAVRKTCIWFIGPALLYMIVFFIMQPHYFGNFSNGFYLDNGDGFQNVWNIWWVNHAVTVQHVNPYFTTMLHAPGGVSLLPQTMNIYNGLVGIVLMHVFGFNLVQAVNFAVVFSFVFGGVTMLWFIQKLHHKYWVSLLAGALFTFSSYHFAHAQGHLQLVSFEFIPLFLLAFWTFLDKMRYRYALLASGALFLVLLCDYYYFFWSVFVAVLWLAWRVWKKQITFSAYHLRVFALFAVSAAVLCGPLVLSLLSLNKHDPLLGFHDPGMFSLDPLSVLMPGGSWYWHTLTDGYTLKLPYLAETSVFFGYGLLLLVVAAFVQHVIRKVSNAPKDLAFWWVIMFGFAILALGPHLKSMGHTLAAVPLPYYFLAKAFPTLELSGMPIRWILIAQIAAIVIGAWVLSTLNLRKIGGRVILVLVIAISAIDLWPRALPLTALTFQPYVYALKQLPYGAVIDDGALTGSEQLYNQTLTGKPIAFGYVTRLPKSVDQKDFLIFATQAQGRYNDICRVYRIRYITRPVARPLPGTTFPTVFNNGRTLIYDMKDSPHC